MRRGLLVLALLALPAAAGPGKGLERVGTMEHPPLAEVSGIDASRAWPGVWWVMNDSGDTARA